MASNVLPETPPTTLRKETTTSFTIERDLATHEVNGLAGATFGSRPGQARPPRPTTTVNHWREQAFLAWRTGCNRLRRSPARQGLCARRVALSLIAAAQRAIRPRSR